MRHSQSHRHTLHTACPGARHTAAPESGPPASPARRALALLLLASIGLGSAAASAARLQLRLLETSDLHMNLLAWDYYQDQPTTQFGLARTASLITAARAEVKNSLLFDNGDLLQGSPMGDYMARVKPLAAGQVHPAYKVLNALGVDAANIGNHEFNYGLPFLRQAIAGAAFPYVSANVHVDDGDGNPDNDAHAFTPYVILQRQFTDDDGRAHTLKVGVIGFVPPQILMWDSQHLAGKLTVRGMAETARRLVPRLRAEGADIVVAIPHSGLDAADSARLSENAVGQLAQVPGIDALLFGHAHAEFPGPAFKDHAQVDVVRGTINGVPAVMPGRWGDHLGVVDLVLDNTSGRWQVADSRSALRPISERATRRALVEPDPRVAALVADEHAGTLAYVRGRVAETLAPITSYFAQVADDPSVQIVSQAQLQYARRALQGTPHEGLPLLSAAAPFKAGGRQGWTYYTDIPAGPLSIRHVADLYIYPNTVKAVRITGAQAREWLEMSAGQFRQIDPKGPAAQDLIAPEFRAYNFDTLDGLRYQIDLTQPARYDADGRLVAPQSRRIVDLRHQGQPVADEAVFIVVTNNYRASGGGHFPGLDGRNTVLDSPDETREALVQHMRSAERLNPSADNNWRLLPVPGVALRFTSGTGGIAHLARYPQIHLVRDNGDGSALYEIRP